MSTEVLEPQQSSNSVANSRGTDGNRAYTVAPAVSVFEFENNWLIQADMPGVSKENARIATEDNYLTVSGTRTKAESTGRKLYRESRTFDYRRTFELPNTVDVGKITARMENGVLAITLPKVEKVLPRTIQVTD